MESLTVECLRCGHLRKFVPGAQRHVEPGDCTRCGYLGWAYPGELTERSRRMLRERPPEQRRLHVVVA